MTGKRKGRRRRRRRERSDVDDDDQDDEKRCSPFPSLAVEIREDGKCAHRMKGRKKKKNQANFFLG